MEKKRSRSEKIIDTVKELVKKFPCLNAKATKDFIDLVKVNGKIIDSYASESFVQMVRKRQAYKFSGMSEQAFKASLNELIAKQTELFKASRSLTADDKKWIEQMNEKAKATRKKTLEEKEIDAKLDLLSDSDFVSNN